MESSISQHRNGVCSRIILGIGIIASLFIVTNAALGVWAAHEFTPTESIVASEADTLAHFSALYHDPNTYPYTISPYGPVFYCLSAFLQRCGCAPIQAGRLISFLALFGVFWCVWRILTLLVENHHARLTGILLVAASANVVAWGGIGQTDMLACFFSLAAFTTFLAWQQRPLPRSSPHLYWCGAFVLLAVFTKQTAVAAFIAIAVQMFANNRRTARNWVVSVAIVAAITALTINTLTSGQYFANTVLANLNPLSAIKLQQHIQQFLLATGGLLAVSLAGFTQTIQRRFTPLYLYSALALVIWLVTCPKIGSELNYQIESAVLLSICAAAALDQLQFFPKLLANDVGWVPLLQIPLLLHLVLNFALSGKIVALRIAGERIRRSEIVELAPYLTPAHGRVLSTNADLVLSAKRPLEIDPLSYTLLTNAGRINPAPLLADLRAARFGTIILDLNVFLPTLPKAANLDTFFLPPPVLDQVRQHYSLVRHADGPYLEGNYVYQPRPVLKE